MLKLIFRILKDERGIEPLTLGAIIAGGGAALGGIFGKKKQKTFDPYEGLRGDWQNWMRGKIGTSTPYEYNEKFTTDQPAVESAVESTILGKLGNLPQMESDIKGISEQYYGAQKEQMEERHMEEQARTKDMYNRLGLVSSTPGLTASTDLGRKQGQEFNVLSADIARQGIQDEMSSMALSEEIANMYLSQGQVLGGAQRGYQQFAQQMSMQDIMRMVEEELSYGNLAGSVLSGNPPQVRYEDNWANILGKAGINIGTSIIGAKA